MLLIISIVFLWHTSIFAQAYNVYFDHTYDYNFLRNDFPREVSPILIIDRNGTSIKASAGLNLIIPANLYTLWDTTVTQVTAEGSAVTNGKMDAMLTPVYSDNLKTVYFPVKANFSLDEEASLTGLKMRVYRTANDKRYIELDLDNDGIGDIVNFRHITISATEIRTDVVAPYSVKKAVSNYAGGAVTLEWKDPADFDLERIIIEKTYERDSQMQNDPPIEIYAGEERYVDATVQEGDIITYKIYSRDSTNLSDPVTISVTAVEAVASSDEGSVDDESSEAETTPDEQITTEDALEEVAEEERTPEEIQPLLSDITEAEKEQFLSGFFDIPQNHWGLEAMTYLTIKESVFSGYGDGSLRIDNPVTRAEISKIAWHAFINQYAPVIPDFAVPFSDVLQNHWFLPYVKIMQEQGIVSGYSDSTFRPLNPVKRVEALAILLKAAAITVPVDISLDDLPFTDIDKDAWYPSFVAFAYQEGFMQGFSDSTFRPADIATRAQIAVIAVKIKDYLRGVSQ